jgi:hypothetical protein
MLRVANSLREKLQNCEKRADSHDDGQQYQDQVGAAGLLVQRQLMKRDSLQKVFNNVEVFFLSLGLFRMSARFSNYVLAQLLRGLGQLLCCFSADRIGVDHRKVSCI